MPCTGKNDLLGPGSQLMRTLLGAERTSWLAPPVLVVISKHAAWRVLQGFEDEGETDLLVRRLLEFHHLLEASCLDLGLGLRLLLRREHLVLHLLRLVLCLFPRPCPAHVEAAR